MASPILVTGAAGRVGAVGRTVTELLLKQGKAVRAMVRTEDERAQALRDMGAEVVVGDLLDLDSMHRVIAGCETMYFGMSVSDAYLAATVNTAAVAKHHGVKAFINMSQMTVAQMSITETTSSPQVTRDVHLRDCLTRDRVLVRVGGRDQCRGRSCGGSGRGALLTAMSEGEQNAAYGGVTGINPKRNRRNHGEKQSGRHQHGPQSLAPLHSRCSFARSGCVVLVCSYHDDQ
jgi:NAD(P)H-binding